jgi:hypothetical protein
LPGAHLHQAASAYRGQPNAWALTDQGAALERALRAGGGGG